ncbi:hypothetical protein HYPSUDRAFT_731717 [Hypholoma sublateritium FD-334 SS-4]|uniref:Uncharacterized protein n=1 Tax=Hypholoma sublateritium (strain FD-334 SS-4) TaxID=945553 RepID=A0A0D2MD20_HYPSF|nr:hypothetical protein HYPSUDRAFT_731717 [Hypholoma sublateritium FD-334 SS-4]
MYSTHLWPASTLFYISSFYLHSLRVAPHNLVFPVVYLPRHFVSFSIMYFVSVVNILFNVFERIWILAYTSMCIVCSPNYTAIFGAQGLMRAHLMLQIPYSSSHAAVHCYPESLYIHGDIFISSSNR